MFYLLLDLRPSCSQDNSMPCSEVSSSLKKLNNSKVPKISEYSETCVHFVVDLEQISKLISSFSKCKYCNSVNCIKLSLDDKFKSGLVIVWV